jgi:polysaccharide chain length determinant protein (PEP-CTERM system associated)
MLHGLEDPPARYGANVWDIIRRRRWWLLLPGFAGWAISVLALYVLPAQYRSEAVILVSGQSVPDTYVSTNVPSQMTQRLQSMTQKILSGTKLQKVIEDFRLYEGKKASLSPDQLVERMRRDIEILPVPIDDLAQKEDPAIAAKRVLTIAPGNGKPQESLVFRISYRAESARVAQQVADALVSLFIEENLAERQRKSETTTSFLQSQVEEARRQLEKQEVQVQQFKSQHLGELPEQKEANLQILAALQSRLQSANDTRNHAEQQRLYLESLSAQYKSLEAGLSFGDTSSTESPATIDKELQRLQAQLTTLRGQYTDRHPDVVYVQEAIAHAEERKKQIETARSIPLGEASNSPRPTSIAEMQQLSPMLQVESQIKSNIREIEGAQASILDLQKQIAEYQRRLDMIPIRSQQIDGIAREYDQLRANFQSLLVKQNDSQVATNLERQQQGQQFEVLFSADLPPRPNAPDRFDVSLIGLGVGFGLGFLLAIVSELVDDRLYSEKELSGMPPAPVLANIPELLTCAEKCSMSRTLRFEWVGGCAMVGVVAAGSAFTFFHG